MRQRSRVELFERSGETGARTRPCRCASSRSGMGCIGARSARRWRPRFPAPQGVPGAGAAGDRPGREIIDGWLIGDQDVPRKQRHTARRVWQRLVAEHGARVAEVTVSRYVAARRVEIGLVDREVFVPQVHAPGAEAEVDFGEFETGLAGSPVKVWMFVMRLSHSGRRSTSPTEPRPQEAFLQATSKPSTTSVASQH